jgi:hypothetical protein
MGRCAMDDDFTAALQKKTHRRTDVFVVIHQ